MISLNNNFPDLFFMMLSLKLRFRKSQHKMINYFHYIAVTPCALYSFIAEYSKIDRSNSDNINLHISQLSLWISIKHKKSKISSNLATEKNLNLSVLIEVITHSILQLKLENQKERHEFSIYSSFSTLKCSWMHFC